MYCSLFMPRMENYQGDLTDIVRASGGAYGSTGAEGASEPSPGWRFPSDPMNFSSVVEEPRDNFGNPFSYMRDPLLYELDVSGSGFFSSTSSAEMMGSSTAASVEDTGGFNGGNTTGAVVGVGGASTSTILAPSNYLEDEMKRPCNIFSRMLQISPNAKLPVSPCGSPVMAAAASPRGIKASAMVAGDMITANSPKGCFIDNTGVQISSPRNPGIKRRKSQAKKVVCIPAPAAANSRPTGEVVPSDLWAWRKYGQKPIKGSPYPRGYYRCSSSKGCSARKQVERSRTDPNMLVITYTSEHNHPWPTQRNALAGSTRSQPSKSNAASKNFQGAQSGKKPTSPKEEQKESSIDDHVSPIVGGSSTTSTSVKEELDEVEKQVLEMDDGEFSTAEGFSYRPTMPVSNLQSDEDFFAELEEIEADPLDLLFSQGFAGDHAQKDSKGMDPFNLFDWPGDSGHGGSNPFGEAKNRGL
ncbi:hypothetical protein I3760_09G144300 [Carya illinoinensis]|nr:hypothetical protein I3760_09G144300 [Carya illinoinensis]